MHPLGESCGPLTLDESINLLNEKDAIIKEMKKELEERPTQKLVGDLMEKLKILEVEISEKSSLLETAEKKIAELSTKIEKPDNRWIKRIFSMRGQETTTSKVSKGSSSNSTTNKATPVEPVVPVMPVVESNRKKLIFFRKGVGSEFDLEHLLTASAEVLGKGTFGTAYKAVLDSGVAVTVKRLKNIDLPENEFRENVARIGELQHQNIVPLLAYYYSKDDKLLVYDFMPMGSLSAVLHGSRGSVRDLLNWETRAKVILSVSQSINYIHSVGPTFCHGNIKSSNVLLSLTFEALLSDHGLYSLLSTSSSHYNAGNNYRDPEMTDLRKMSQKTDVYSFGMLMLEILTGKSPYQAMLMNEDVATWVRSLDSAGRIDEAFDVDLEHNQSTKNNEDMMQLMQLALNCTARVNRPSIADAVVMIEKILKING